MHKVQTGGEKTTPHLRAKSRLRRLRSETHLRVQSQKSKIFASSPDKGSLFISVYRFSSARATTMAPMAIH